jgi:lipopolysaccharide export system permease protein
MNILDRYILRAISGTSALVMSLLIALNGFVVFIGQLEDVGKGEFGIWDALTYSLLMIPTQTFDLMPVAALLGSLMGLGRLAAQSELTVMRAAGVSPWRLAMSAFGVGIILTLATGALGEFIAPPMERYATQQRAMAQNTDVQFDSRQNVWLKHGNQIINARARADGNWEGGVYLFGFDSQLDLKSIGRAEAASLSADGRWHLEQLRESSFDSGSVSVRHESIHPLDPGLSPELMGLSEVRPQTMSAQDLISYRDYLRRNKLESRSYEIIMWFRIAGILSVSVMTTLAVPFVFGSLRNSGGGVRLLIGIMIGVGYFLANRTLANSGQVFDLNPILVACIPTLVLMMITVMGLSRIR